MLPPFLVRKLSVEDCGAWTLVLQVALYFGFVDFAIQTAAARLVAYAEELNDAVQRDRIASTPFCV